MKIGYSRVSDPSQNADLQRDALIAQGCDHIFEDHGLSGRKVKRPELDKALEIIKPGDMLVVWKLDRLGRSVQFLSNVVEDLLNRGIGFHSISDGIDTTKSSGKLLFHIIASIAEFESALISERTIAGMRAAKLRGKHVGRPKSSPDQV